MKKFARISLIVLLVVLLISVLVACDMTNKQDTTGGSSNKDQVSTVTSKPVRLSFTYLTRPTTALSGMFVDEFDIANIEYHVVYEVRTRYASGKLETTYTTGEGKTLTLDKIVEEDQAYLSVAGNHMIHVADTVDKHDVSGAFSLKLKERNEIETVTLTFNLGGGTATFGVVEGDTSSIIVLRGAKYSWSEFISSFSVHKTDMAIKSWTYANGTRTFDPTSDPITFNLDTTFDAVWTSSNITVDFDLNLPEGAIGNPLPSAPASAQVAKNAGIIPRPDVKSVDTLTGYSLAGWVDENGNLWDFGKVVGTEDMKLKAVWNVKKFAVTFNLLGGMFSSVTDASTVDKQIIEPTILYNVDPKQANYKSPYKITVEGLEFGRKLSDYVIQLRPSSDATNYIYVNIGELAQKLNKGDDYYTIEGWYVDSAFNTKFDSSEGVKVSGEYNLFAKWNLSSTLTPEQINSYYTEYLFDYTLLSDGTARIDLFKDYAINTLIIPYSIKVGGIEYPISEIGKSAGINLKSLVKFDASKATKLRTIDEKALAYCPGLRDVIWPAVDCAIEYMGLDAFRDCPWITNYGADNDEDYLIIGSVLFKYYGSKDITKLDLSAVDAKSIASGAFAGLASLTEAKLGTVEVIENGAFENCSMLTSVEANAAMSIGSNAFKATSFINGAGNDTDHIVIGSIYYRYIGKSQTTAVIPKNVKIVAANAFTNGGNIKNIEFEEGCDANIFSIGANAFGGTMWVYETVSYPNPKTYIKNGFVVVNGILANYTGSETKVTIPDDVTSIAPYAFNGFKTGSITNLIISAEASLKHIQDYAFYGLDSLIAISFIKDDASLLSDLRMDGRALQGREGNFIGATVSGAGGKVSVFKVYCYESVYSSVNVHAENTWAALKNNNMLSVLTTSNVRVNSNLPTSYLMTDSVNGVNFINAWEAVNANRTPDNYLIQTINGVPTLMKVLTVLRSDGISRDENYPMTQVWINALEGKLAEGVHNAMYTMSLKFDDITTNVNYTVYADIKQDSISILGYDSDPDGTRLYFYTSNITFNASRGRLAFNYINDAAGAEKTDISLATSAINVSGYNPSIGTKVLYVKFNYFGLKTIDYQISYSVSVPKDKSIKQLTSLSIPLNVPALSYLSTVKFRVTKTDGSTKDVNGTAVYVSMVDYQTATTLDTSSLGFHTARVDYGSDKEGYVSCDFVFSVVLASDPAIFNIQPISTDAASGTGTAAISGVKAGHRDTIAIPSVITQNGIKYTIVSIADSAFAGNTALTNIYIASTVKTIGKHAFQNCVNLENVFTFEDQASGISTVGMEHLKIVSETITTSAEITVTGLNRATSLGSVIRIPMTTTITQSVDNTGNDAYYNCITKIVNECDVILPETINPFLGYEGVIYIPNDAKYDAAVTFYKSYENETYTIIRYSTSTVAVNFEDTFTFSSPNVLSAVKTGEVGLKADAEIQPVDGAIVLPSLYSGAYSAAVEGEYDYTYTYTLTTALAGSFRWMNNTGVEKLFVPSTLIYIDGTVNGLFGLGRQTLDVVIYDVTLDYISNPVHHVSSGLEKISEHAFSGCSSLRGFDLTNATNLSEIRHNAFEGCSSLYVMDFSNTLISEIEGDTFKNCTGLLTIVFGHDVEIGPAAFYGCSKLATVSGVQHIRYIGTEAFFGCIVGLS